MPTLSSPLRNHLLFHGAAFSVSAAFIGVTMLYTFAHHQATFAYRLQPHQPAVSVPTPFPVGVNPATKVITEQPEVEDFVNTYLASNHTPRRTTDRWLARVSSALSLQSWYQSLASASGRILVIQSGERREQVSANFAKILGWDTNEQERFLALTGRSVPEAEDGMFYPGRYTVASDASPEAVALLISNTFTENVLARYPDTIDETVPLRDTLIIASLIEREAYDFEDMRYISGVIWNRLFIDMRLQIDATLQYARANQGGNRWWPVPRPADKYIDSPFNTYQIAGLPPAPIANPSIDAIVAALNPRQTECIFYFHDTRGGFHCTETYEEHVSLLRQYYGQGR